MIFVFVAEVYRENSCQKNVAASFLAFKYMLNKMHIVFYI